MHMTHDEISRQQLIDNLLIFSQNTEIVFYHNNQGSGKPEK